MSDLQWVTNLQLPFLSWKAVIQRDPQICARDIAKVLPINDYLPLGGAGQFCYRSAALQVGELTLATVAHTNVSVSAPAITSATATFLLPYSGMAVSHSHGQQVTYQPGQAVLVSRAGLSRTETSAYSGVALRISHAALERVARAMAPHHFQERDFLAAISGCRVFSLEKRTEAILLNQIRHLTTLVDPLLEPNGQLQSWSCLDDQLCRRLVALLLPALIEHSAGEAYRHREGAHNSRLDALIDHMRANLHGPLGLSELESRSGYSRLVLQHLFLRHFGCTPRQWIHRERLRRAERSLKA